MLCMKSSLFALALLCAQLSVGYMAQHSTEDDDSIPLLDMASIFLQEALNNQNSGDESRMGGNAVSSLAGVASLVGNLIQANAGGVKSDAGSGAMQILSGIGTLLANAGNSKNSAGGGGGGVLDPALFGNVIEIFAQGDNGDEVDNVAEITSQRRNVDTGAGLQTLLQIASAFMNTRSTSEPQLKHHQQKRSTIGTKIDDNNDNLLNLLPLVIQAISSFVGPEGQHTQERHKNHAWVLPPFLEHIHVLWDHFANSELADALYDKSGINKVLKGFKGRDGKLNYDKLFESLNNQSFRRRWIKTATLYLADWASYLANPDVYLKYLQTAQVMFNSLLKSQGYPKITYFDPTRASETLSNLLDHVAKHHLNVKIDSRQYVKPVVAYAKELLKLGQARGLLQFNATDISDKLTDTLNLEVIEPVLKVHRAYRFISKSSQCDRYVLCQLNTPEQNTVDQTTHAKSTSSSTKVNGLISGVSPKIIKIGSIGAAIFISTETGTPFWTLFGVINSPHNCEVKYPVDCSGFHEGEAKVTTEYIHNEL